MAGEVADQTVLIEITEEEKKNIFKAAVASGFSYNSDGVLSCSLNQLCGLLVSCVAAALEQQAAAQQAVGDK